MDTMLPSSTRMDRNVGRPTVARKRARNSEAGRPPGRNGRGQERCGRESGEERAGEERRTGRECIPEVPGEDRCDEEADAAEQVVQAEYAAAHGLGNARGDQRTLAPFGEPRDDAVPREECPGVPGRARLREAGIASCVDDPTGGERTPAAQSIREPSQRP